MKRFALSGPVLAALLLVGAQAQAIDVHRDEVKAFIDEVSARDSIAKRPLRKLLAEARSQSSIIEAMDRPAEKAKPWFEYRPIFLTDRRIQEGAIFGSRIDANSTRPAFVPAWRRSTSPPSSASKPTTAA